MSKKLALTDDEILLCFVLQYEGREIDRTRLTRLYSDILPELVTRADSMIALSTDCGWTKSELDDTLSALSKETRLKKLAPCAMICARYISNAYMRGRQAEVMISGYFKSSEKRELEKFIKSECAGLSLNEDGIRKPCEDIASELENTLNGSKEALRRRAALRRAKAALKPETRINDESRYVGISGENDKGIEEIAMEMFPQGLSDVNALAVRLVQKRVTGRSKDEIWQTLNSVCVRRDAEKFY